jgi:very-short-patch-repair endonuclease
MATPDGTIQPDANRLRPKELKSLREHLGGGEPFLKLANFFMDSQFAEIDDPAFKEYYKLALPIVTKENAGAVDACAKSPIEKIFLNSLILSFITNDGLGLFVHQTRRDAAAEIADFRITLQHFKKFLVWFEENQPAETMEAYFDEQVRLGRMCQGERDGIARMLFRYGYLPLEDRFHMTIQPRFPNIKVLRKSIRPDIYFWVPSNPRVNIIVECDGYAHHADKETFMADRKKDRALKALGYDVYRFSGGEIYNDPANSAHELAEHLWRSRDAHELEQN